MKTYKVKEGDELIVKFSGRYVCYPDSHYEEDHEMTKEELLEYVADRIGEDTEGFIEGFILLNNDSNIWVEDEKGNTKIKF